MLKQSEWLLSGIGSCYKPAQQTAGKLCCTKESDILWDFPGGPVVRTQHFHCWSLGSIPAQGTKILQAMWRSQKKKNQIF